MSETLEVDELTLLLARAFDSAWSRYYSAGRSTLSADVARPALANHLVQIAQQGKLDERALATAGLNHLTSLSTEEPPDLSA